jgi:menaquinone-dependent protoporphyrinogen oxidase
MKKVLVVFASRMGSTGEIAATIGKQLTSRGFEVDVRPAWQAHDARNYDAVIVGSAIYLRHWDRQALEYLQAQAPDLAERPTWLFQSGPCGPATEIAHTDAPRAVVKFCQEIGIAEPTTFGGNLDPAKANGLLARLVSRGDLAGDFRNWAQIRAWAESVADELDSARTLMAV